ncbi:MAG TPA: glycosyltransferase family 2 protein [Chloroflexota bacterium]|nr:glycosyltransferase family 2 protein [Chloroflexota bacterium]
MTTDTLGRETGLQTRPAEHRVSVIILNYNTSNDLRTCLRSVQQTRVGMDQDAIETFVVDNASTDGSADMVAAEFPWVKLIRADRNGGYAYGNNLALRESSGRYVMLLNPDALIPPGAIEALYDYLDAHPRAAVVGPRVLRPDGSLDLACRRSFPTLEVSSYRMLGLSKLFPRSRKFGRYNLTYLDADEGAEVDSVVGACMLVRRAAIEQVGLLDEQFFMYGEDLDWAFRMKQAGWSILYHPGVTVLHRKGESSRRRSEAATVAFYDAMEIFYRKHYARQHSGLVNALVQLAIRSRCAISQLQNALRPEGKRRVGT